MMLRQLNGLLAKPTNVQQQTALADALRQAMQDRFNRAWRKVADDTLRRLETADSRETI